MSAKKKAKRLPKPVPFNRVAELVKAEGEGHEAGCHGAHAVAASWLVSLVAELTGMSGYEVGRKLAYEKGTGNAHFVKAGDILREHFDRIAQVAKRRNGAK